MRLSGRVALKEDEKVCKILVEKSDVMVTLKWTLKK
jgi:hypothetical protein